MYFLITFMYLFLFMKRAVIDIFAENAPHSAPLVGIKYKVSCSV